MWTGTITAFFTALAAYFGWRQKVAPTPPEREVQSVRKERDDAHVQADDWIDSKKEKK